MSYSGSLDQHPAKRALRTPNPNNVAQSTGELTTSTEIIAAGEGPVIVDGISALNGKVDILSGGSGGTIVWSVTGVATESETAHFGQGLYVEDGLYVQVGAGAVAYVAYK